MEAIPLNAAILFLLLFIVGKSSVWAVRSAVSVSRSFGISEFSVSFIVIALASALPETVISVIAAFRGDPALGMGTLLGSNVADLTLVFGLIPLIVGRDLKVESVFIKKDYLFLAFLLLPLALGFTGRYSRLDGAILVGACLFFFYLIVKESAGQKHLLPDHAHFSPVKTAIIALAALTVLGVSAGYAVKYAEHLAAGLRIAPALVGLLVVGLGTTLPEFLFAIRAAGARHTTLALGDILGTVVIDATLILGVTILIQPFSFNPRLIIVTGVFMFLAGLFVLSLFRSGRTLARAEGALLLAFYALFIIIEFSLRNWTPLLK